MFTRYSPQIFFVSSFSIFLCAGESAELTCFYILEKKSKILTSGYQYLPPKAETHPKQMSSKILMALINFCIKITSVCHHLPLWSYLNHSTNPWWVIIFHCCYYSREIYIWWQYFHETPSSFLSLGPPTYFQSYSFVFFSSTPPSAAYTPSTAPSVFDLPDTGKSNSYPMESFPAVAMVIHLATDAIATLFLPPWEGIDTSLPVHRSVHSHIDSHVCRIWTPMVSLFKKKKKTISRLNIFIQKMHIRMYHIHLC